jgi:hypothetical protein
MKAETRKLSATLLQFNFPACNRWRRRDAARIAQRLPQLLDEVVVVFVRADPKPDDEIAVFLRNNAIVISDSY